ncbi:hypothetical protein EVA_20089 [gut metagenome]|uniref:Uncharacterized protein n=1 Tax=gut metagenome TaxID=749906 RepID=J9BW59_9ZZZZ
MKAADAADVGLLVTVCQVAAVYCRLLLTFYIADGGQVAKG